MKEPKMLALVEEDYITKKKVALRLNKTCRTIDYWMKRGWIPYYKIGSVRFKMTEVEPSCKELAAWARNRLRLKCQKNEDQKDGKHQTDKVTGTWETKWEATWLSEE